MIKQNGYKCGTYKVVSEDGYTSLIFRVLPQEDDGGEKGQPIVLDHGVQVNSAAWTWMGNRSLGIKFASHLTSKYIVQIPLSYSIRSGQSWL